MHQQIGLIFGLPDSYRALVKKATEQRHQMTIVTEPTGKPGIIWDTPWPEHALETLGTCPVCGNAQKTILHADIVDNTFFCAPGKWQLWKCARCQSAYLDPRPTPESIGAAYASYYTHGGSKTKLEYADLGMLGRIRRQLVNGYTRKKFGSPSEPHNRFGYLLFSISPLLKRIPDRWHRNLPRPSPGSNRLLDIGCGDGEFLELAHSCGWDVCGLEPDNNAVQIAKAKGLRVINAGEEYFDGKKELFDVVTLSHVIEHVHEPLNSLKKCFDLLKPGGSLWIETPNVDSLGGREFGPNWRGWETPRHLVLFNRSSLHYLLSQAGFSHIADVRSPNHATWTFKVSEAMATGRSPDEPIEVGRIFKARAQIANWLGTVFPTRKEFLTVIAFKPE